MDFKEDLQINFSYCTNKLLYQANYFPLSWYTGFYGFTN